MLPIGVIVNRRVGFSHREQAQSVEGKQQSRKLTDSASAWEYRYPVVTRHVQAPEAPTVLAPRLDKLSGERNLGSHQKEQ
jgi:hypothetical protein